MRQPILPGSKQVFRFSEANVDVRDVIATASEDLPGRPLLRTVMKNGKRVNPAPMDLTPTRNYASEQIARLPERVRGLAQSDPPYPVEVSAELSRLQLVLEQRAADRTG
jgi:nicotinate phosphoribosyltransferase